MFVCVYVRNNTSEGGVSVVSIVADTFIMFCGRCVNKAKHKHIPEDGAWVIWRSAIRLHNINNKDSTGLHLGVCVCV